MKKRKIFEIALSVFCALCLWIYVVTVVTPDDDLVIENIPVTFAGESALRSENNMIITNRSARSISVTFHGSRVLLKQLEAEKNNISAVLDVSSFTSERDYSSSYEIILPTMLQNDDIQILEYSPKVISFTVETQARKQVNVKGIFDGTVASGCVAGDLVFGQDTLQVTGPAELVDQVSYAQVVMGGKDLSRTTTKEIAVTLISRDGEQIRSEDIIVSTTDIQVTLPVYIEKTLPLAITPVYGEAENADNTTITIEPATVTLWGEPDTLRIMTELSLGELELADLLNTTPITMDIPLPDGFILKSGNGTARVNVRFTDLVTQTLKVSGFVLENVPEGMKATALTKELEITFRGTQEELQKLNLNNISVTADLSEYKSAGEFNIPVEISVNGVAATALSSYSVRVELEK